MNALAPSPLVTYALEPWAKYWPDCEPLWRAHYAEFEPFHQGRLPFGPDIPMYMALDRAGMLQIMVARAHGAMVGYCLVTVKRHPHYDMICGFEDSYYISPPWRKGWNGIRLIDRSAATLAKRGVKMTYWMTKEFNTIQRVFEFLGFTKCDSVYYNWTGG